MAVGGPVVAWAARMQAEDLSEQGHTGVRDFKFDWASSDVFCMPERLRAAILRDEVIIPLYAGLGDRDLESRTVYSRPKRVMTPPHSERYVKRPEVAAAMGVSVKTVDRWVASGMPSYTWGLRARRFLLSEVEIWAAEREGAPV
jgi:predicted DNA-binding transcriptional regulator AlpA